MSVKSEDLLKWVELSRSALQGNLAEFRRIVPAATALMAVVKSNAYGHGLLDVAALALDAGATWLGVNELDEALALRQAGHLVPILVMGAVAPTRLEEAAHQGLRCVVYDRKQVGLAEDAARRAGRKLKLHVKLETGLNRQGVADAELDALAGQVAQSPWLELDGLSTHFANIEDTTDHTFARSQLERFARGLQRLIRDGRRPATVHCACTAAALVMQETAFDLVRLGIGMYGLWPSKETQLSVYMDGSGRRVTLRPVLTWKTRIVQVKEVARGAAVGYGCTEHVSHPSKVAVLPVGYFDGYDRGLSNQGQVLVRGQRARLTGRICMNMCMIDVTHLEGIAPGEEVVLLGAQGEESLPAEFVASQLATINYEVVTRIGPHQPRLVVP